MGLSDTALRTFKAGAKDTKKADDKGLYLLVKTTGGKLWRLDYRFEGKRKTLSMGTYPDTGLKAARERRDEARKMLAQGIDPGATRKAQKAAGVERAANSFEVVARRWHDTKKGGWTEKYAAKVLATLERDVFPWIGGTALADARAPDGLSLCRRIVERGAIDTAHTVKGYLSSVMRFAVGEGLIDSDPFRDMRGNLPAAPKVKHFASMNDPAKVGGLMRAIDAFEGGHIVRSALLLTPLVFTRPGELRKAKWADIDLDAAEWRYTATKTDTPHIVPLSRQAVAILRDIFPLTGRNEHVFPGARDHQRPMSDAAVNAALRRMGYDTQTEITGHGFRSMACTMLQERLGKPKSWIERQLAHDVDDPNGAAYDRAQWIDERRVMMQEWADYLDRLKAGAEVIPLHGAA
ncbi:integrase [Betaproteobacteria bacterium]|nr:integrase [Betaproteobacteria bacterium]GHU23562.1 integrase [Betaproteobacteria bacterium]